MKTLLDTLPLNGSKTYISGVIMIVIGISGAIMGVVQPDSPFAIPVEKAVELVVGGLAILGIGHKLDKAKP